MSFCGDVCVTLHLLHLSSTSFASIAHLLYISCIFSYIFPVHLTVPVVFKWYSILAIRLILSECYKNEYPPFSSDCYTGLVSLFQVTPFFLIATCPIVFTRFRWSIVRFVTLFTHFTTPHFPNSSIKFIPFHPLHHHLLILQTPNLVVHRKPKRQI